MPRRSATKSNRCRPTAPRPSQSRRFTADCSIHAPCGALAASDRWEPGAKRTGPSCRQITPTAVTGIADCRVCRDEPFAWCDGNGHRSARNRRQVSQQSNRGCSCTGRSAIRRHDQIRRRCRNSAPAEQATSPTQHRPATVQPPLASKLAAPPTAASQDPGQPATEPLTATAAAPSSSAVAFATGAPIGEGFAQSKPPQIVRSEAAGGSPPVQQTVPSPPLAKASAATQERPCLRPTSTVDVRTPPSANAVAEPRAAPVQAARSTTRTPANHGPLAAVTPTQAGSRPLPKS